MLTVQFLQFPEEGDSGPAGLNAQKVCPSSCSNMGKLLKPRKSELLYDC